VRRKCHVEITIDRERMSCLFHEFMGALSKGNSQCSRRPRCCRWMDGVWDVSSDRRLSKNVVKVDRHLSCRVREDGQYGKIMTGIRFPEAKIAMNGFKFNGKLVA